MAYTTQEGLDNAGDLLKALALRVSEESDGGTSITLAEWLEVAQEIGLKVIQDVMD
jgi:hypothetical protein